MHLLRIAIIPLLTISLNCDINDFLNRLNSNQTGSGLSCADVETKTSAMQIKAFIKNPNKFEHTGKAAETSSKDQNDNSCTGYPDGETSDYVLPYHPGVERYLTQGNCTGSHKDGSRYAFDFVMPKGSCIEAIGTGKVINIDDDTLDYDADVSYSDPGVTVTDGNEIHVQHEDGSVAKYKHIMQNGAIPKMGDKVKRGDALAYSGHNGFSTSPHIHLIVVDESDENIPVAFNNAITVSTDTNNYGNLPSSYTYTDDAKFLADQY